MKTARLIAFGIALLFSLFISISSVLAYGYGYGCGYNYYGCGYGGYAGPYSYQFVPHSFWGRYYNPSLYYVAMDYSAQQNMLRVNQQNLKMTYDFLSYNL